MECSNCPVGQYQDEPEQSDCKDCADCETSLDGATFCWECAQGRFQNVPNQGTYATHQCKACPANQFTEQPNLSMCTACPAPHWAVDATYDYICWHCDAGTYRVPTALSQSAPQDYECLGTRRLLMAN